MYGNHLVRNSGTSIEPIPLMVTLMFLPTLTFNYMYLRSSAGQEDVIWSRHGDHGQKWFQAMATLRTGSQHTLTFELVVDDLLVSVLVVDDLVFSEGPCGEW
jgi:hypothetical protein